MLIRNGFIMEILRSKRDFKSQEAFVEGICDVRQYRRYINNESQMPVDVLSLFLGRANMTVAEFLGFYSEEERKETMFARGIYNHLMTGKFERADEMIHEYAENRFVLEANKTLYSFCKYFYQRKKDLTFLLEYKDYVATLINYPRILNFQFLSHYEMLILSSYSQDLPINERDKVIDKLTEVLINHEVTDMNSLDSHLIILYSLIQHHGMKKHFIEALKLCEIGIKISFEYHHHYLIGQLYYFKSLCHHQLNQIELRNEAIVKCVQLFDLDNNQNLRDHFYKLIEKDFELILEDVMIDYWQKQKKDRH